MDTKTDQQSPPVARVRERIRGKISEHQAAIRALDEVETLLDQRDGLAATIAAHEKRIAELSGAKADAQKLLEDMKKLIAKASAERARILADVDSEVAARDEAVACAVALASNLQARCVFLLSRGWLNMRSGYQRNGVGPVLLPEVAIGELLREAVSKLNAQSHHDSADIKVRAAAIEKVATAAS